jgi:hypothetical protein
MKRILLAVVVLVICIFFFSSSTKASLAIGIRLREIQVQEYWHKGAPQYLIINSLDSAVVISAGEYHYDSEGGGRPTKSEYGPILVNWSVPPHNSKVFDASALVDARYVYVKSGDLLIGLIYGPKRPDVRISSRYATFGGVNVGGWPHNDRIWIEQKDIYYRPGSEIELTMVTEADRGLIGFGSYVPLWRMVNRRPDDVPANHPHTLIESVILKSKTLPIELVDGVYIIDTDHPLKEKSFHRVKMKLVIPSCDRQFVELVGFRWWERLGGSGYFIDRVFPLKNED